MENERSIDRLARYILATSAIILVGAACWYFKNVLIYIILAAVVSLIGRPIMKLFKKISFKGKRLPSWILAVLTLIILISLFLLVATQVVPVVSGIVQSITANVSDKALNASPRSFTSTLYNINKNLYEMFPALGRDFRIEDEVLNFIKNTFSISSVSSVIGSVASLVADLAIAIFSIVFISFFFIRNDKLFRNIIAALVPDKYELPAKKAVGDIEHLLSRYFVGLIIEVCGVALIDFLGLWTICGLKVEYAFGLAFIAGLLNIVPYVGPLTGGVIGTILGMLLKVSQASAIGIPIHFWLWAALFIAVFTFTQLVDNFVFQPVIYSTSIKSSPLEIFIVLLIAGHVGGIWGMLVAIPGYTVIRVIASTFFYDDVKAIRRLIPDNDKQKERTMIRSYSDEPYDNL